MRGLLAQFANAIRVFGAKTLNALGPGLVRRAQLLDPGQRRFVRLKSREALFFVGDVIVDNPQPANQRLQAQSLHNQRSENDAKRQEQDKVTAWKRRPVRQKKRNGESSG